MIITRAGSRTPNDLIELMHRELHGLRHRSASSAASPDSCPPGDTGQAGGSYETASSALGTASVCKTAGAHQTDRVRETRPIACAGCFFAPDCTSTC
jgi:hypothetical protein